MQVAELAAERVGSRSGRVRHRRQRGARPRGMVRRTRSASRASAGLHLVAHAGESMGPESIWAALELGAERIGHGIAAMRDEALMRHLRDHDIPLEVCPTSNLVTGRGEERSRIIPLRRLYDAGVPIILNSDDPAMFRCSLVGEYRLAAKEFAFTETELQAIANNAFRYAFDAAEF